MLKLIFEIRLSSSLSLFGLVQRRIDVPVRMEGALTHPSLDKDVDHGTL